MHHTCIGHFVPRHAWHNGTHIVHLRFTCPYSDTHMTRAPEDGARVSVFLSAARAPARVAGLRHGLIDDAIKFLLRKKVIVVTKIPRFAFEKFPQADPTLTTQMKSVGEAMAIGRTFKESLQKCLRSLEIGRSGLGGDGKPWRIGTEVYGDRDILPREVISRKLSVPNAERIFFIRHALRAGFTIEEIFNLTKIDRWFLVQLKEIVDFEEELAGLSN